MNTFVFSATLFAYCFWGFNEKKDIVLYALLILSFIGALSQLFYMPNRALYAIVPVGLVGLGYTFPVIPTIRGWKKLRDIYWLKILWIAFSFSFLTTFLPAIYINSVSAIRNSNVLFIFARSFLFISAICIPFDIRDMKFDRRKGTHTLPVMKGINKSVLIAITLIILFLLLVLLQHFYCVLGIRETIALFISGIITMAVMPLAKPERSKLFFSIIYDGELLWQWVLLMVFIHF